MDWKFSFVLITVLFAMATGWQLALFISPQEYSLAGWLVCGVGTLVCLVGAARGA